MLIPLRFSAIKVSHSPWRRCGPLPNIYAVFRPASSNRTCSSFCTAGKKNQVCDMNGWSFLRTRGLNPSRPGHVLCLSLTLPDMKFQSQRQFGKCTLSLPYTLLDLKVAKSFRCSCQFHLNFIATETSVISLCFGCFLFFFTPHDDFSRQVSRIHAPPIHSFRPPDRYAGLWSQHLRELAKPVRKA